MNRQTSQISHNSSTQLYYSQYLKQQQVSPITEKFVGEEVQELRKQVEQLTKQLEFKEQMISEMRAHQKILMNRLSEPTNYQKDNLIEKLKEFEVQLKEKEVQFQNQLIENSLLVKENKSLKQEITRLESLIKDPSIQKFVNSIVDLVIQCHPQNHFPNSKPELRECWRWLKKILNDYIQLKQSLH
ncbi:unnamed protein product (macronuclear) [Paramecium tetraurelia]|uniref:Uncharacterized protein n=1 Tax=Paramecium tetraurelia TaxID=5888 RepID=A0BPW1_PARTE|nr:uncharacterized protein GSPATT00005328001 [Paramecium tetraurelia]CAK60578.1 unnamed protein product [Paramecium tetraurelia]|eukprot:XP_001427976.1 hypothetical protein (macronuclear) [Paramecium tetraurelia strain d4-2]